MQKTILPLAATFAGIAGLSLVVAQSQAKTNKQAADNQVHAPKANGGKASVLQTPIVQARVSKSVTHKVPPAITPRRAKLDISPELRKKWREHDAPGNQMIKEARDLLRANDVEGAERKCRQAMEYFRENEISIPHELLGDILLAKGDYEAALESYDHSLFYGDSDFIYIHISLCYIRLGDLEQARKSFLMCPWTDLRKLAADPLPDDMKDMPGTKDLKSMEATLMMALAIITADGYEQKLKYLQAADKLVPESWLIADKIGQMLDRLNRYGEAVTNYRRAMQLGGDKVSYDHRMRVEMFDLRQKQQKQNKQKEKAPK